MKKRNLLLLMMLAFALVFTGCKAGGGKKDGICAVVDGVEIPQKNFDLYYGIQRDGIVGQVGEEMMNQPVDKLGRTYGELLRENIFSSLISNQVILNQANKEDLGDIDAKVKEQIAQEKELSGEDVFLENLEKLNLTEEEYENLIKEHIIIGEYRNKKIEAYEVTDEEIKAYYEENKDNFLEAEARHILVETEDEAKKVIERIEAGEDFAELAKELSKDPGSAENGGSLGYFPKGMMVPEFEDFVFSAQVGELSEPIQTDYGFHIIEVTGIKDKMEDFTDQITAGVKSQKFVDEMAKLEEKAKIEKIYDTAKEPQSILEKIEAEKQEKPEETAPAEGQEAPVEETVEPVEETEENKDKSDGK